MKNKINWILSLFFACSILLVPACSDGDDTDTDDTIKVDIPGKISGLGATEGPLTGKKYELPDGIVATDKIKGAFDDYFDASFNANQPSALRALWSYSVDYDVSVGSGYAVTVLLPLENITDKDIELTFPAGMILKSKNNDRQNGLLIKKATVTVPKKEKLRVILNMYCCHETKPAPSNKDEMEWAVITNSSLLLEICDMVKNKKVNMEEFEETNINRMTYFDQCTYINDRVWDLTDRGNALTETHRLWFKNLPDSK
ncbi:hypothetical protein [Parabacteroides sp. PF5-9]|uniref:hypothetical protein n=1 Tax=Parabacteroides sp. PF5-9 TaxID=1742404 RepID=UPI0024770A36|nr:hypothetical protein [Parabacteroides sp. PF5-9]MDH6357917.1 hypothetical protein [Parabacteroides sp. PF5-9]